MALFDCPFSVYAEGLSLLLIYIGSVIGKGTVVWLSELHRITGHRPKLQAIGLSIRNLNGFTCKRTSR